MMTMLNIWFLQIAGKWSSSLTDDDDGGGSGGCGSMWRQHIVMFNVLIDLLSGASQTRFFILIIVTHMYCMPVFFQFFIYLFVVGFFLSSFFYLDLFQVLIFIFPFTKRFNVFLFSCCSIWFSIFFFISFSFHWFSQSCEHSETESISKINWGWTLTWRLCEYDMCMMWSRPWSSHHCTIRISKAGV